MRRQRVKEAKAGRRCALPPHSIENSRVHGRNARFSKVEAFHQPTVPDWRNPVGVVDPGGLDFSRERTQRTHRGGKIIDGKIIWPQWRVPYRIERRWLA